MELPQRSSLVTQVTEILRHGIERGEWSDPLPGELALCERLKVSRTTLRGALDILRREGWIVASRGQRMRIARRTRRTASPMGSKVVGLLSVLPSHLLSSFSHFVISELQESLHDAGYKLEVHAHRRFRARNPARSLSNLMEHTCAACWVLLPPTTACMRWFADHRVRCVVFGTGDWSSTVPSVDVDLRAVSRHAVGLLRGRGHTRIALIVTDLASPGRSAIEEGFRQSFPRARMLSEAEPFIVRVPDALAEMKTTLDSIFASPNRPTGLLVARPKHVLTVMSHLASKGIGVPRDVSVICLGHDPFLDNVTPSVARYTFNWKSFARRLAVMVRQLADTGSVPRWEILVMPQFQQGETLATPPA